MMDHSQVFNEQGLYDIYDMWHTPWWQTRLFYAGVSFVFVAITTYTILRLVHHYRLKARYKQPWEIALLELNALKKSRLDTIQANMECYAQLCWSLKKYVSARFQLALEGKTEEEVIAALTMQAEMPTEHIRELQEIFQGGTLVKFANLSVMREQVLHDLERGMHIILATRPYTHN